MNNISLFRQRDCRVNQWGGGWASIARWVMGSFQYRPSATSENIENHEPGERMMMHQSIRQKSKHIREPLIILLLEAKSFLGDIDSITLNESSTNVSDYVAGYICHKETETLLRMLRSTSLVWWTKSCIHRDTFHGSSEQSFHEVTRHCYKGLRTAWCSQQCYQVFNTGLKKGRNCDTS